MSSPRRAKSADKIDGAISIIGSRFERVYEAAAVNKEGLHLMRPARRLSTGDFEYPGLGRSAAHYDRKHRVFLDGRVGTWTSLNHRVGSHARIVAALDLHSHSRLFC